MADLDLPGVDHDRTGTTLILKGEVTPEKLEKVKKAIEDLNFGYEEVKA